MPPKTLFEKFTMLVSSNLSELVGPVSHRPKGGKPVTVSGYIQHVKREIRGIDKAAHDMIARVRVLHDRLDAYARQCRELDRIIDLYLTQGNQAAAVVSQKKLNRLQPRMKRTYEELQEWESRLLLLKEKRDRFEALLADAEKKAKEQKARKDTATEESAYWVVD